MVYRPATRFGNTGTRFGGASASSGLGTRFGVDGGLTLPTIADLALHLDASSAVAYTGNDVTQMTDLSGNDYHLVQGGGGNRPTRVVAAVNGLDVVRFNGSNQWLANSDAGLQTVGNSGTVLMVVVPGAVGADKTAISWDTGGTLSGARVLYPNDTFGGNGFRMYANGSGFDENSGTDRAGAAHLFDVRMTSASRTARVNGSQVATSSVGLTWTTPTRFQLGRWNTGQYGTFDLCELLIYSRILDVAELDQLRTDYLKIKWATP